MFLGSVTNADLLKAIQSISTNHDFWQNVLIAVIGPIFSLIVLFFSNKHSENQLEKQFQNERKNIEQDKKLQLKVEEKAFIDKEIIKNLTELAKILPVYYTEDLVTELKAIAMYYYSEKDSFKDLEERKNEAIYIIKKYENHISKYGAEIKNLLAYSDEETQNKMRNLEERIFKFDAMQVYNQLNYLSSQNRAGMKTLMSGDKVIELYEQCNAEFRDINNSLSKQLKDKIKSFSN